MTVYATITKITKTPEPNFSDYSEVTGTALATAHDGTTVELAWESPEGFDSVFITDTPNKKFFEIDDIGKIEVILTHAISAIEAEAAQAATEVWNDVWVKKAVEFEIAADTDV